MSELTTEQREALGAEWAALAELHRAWTLTGTLPVCDLEPQHGYPCPTLRALVALADERMENRQLRQALRIYGDPNWVLPRLEDCDAEDNGERARQALGQ